MTLQKDQVIETVLEDNARLQQAIVDLNDWLGELECVSLEWIIKGRESDNPETVAAIRKILKNAS